MRALKSVCAWAYVRVCVCVPPVRCLPDFVSSMGLTGRHSKRTGDITGCLFAAFPPLSLCHSG